MRLFRRKSYCPKLWDEVYINEKGNVFSCCHNSPENIGNIYKDNLKNIYNNEIIQLFRQKSLLGQLHCYKNCALLEKGKIIYIEKPLTIEYNSLRFLHILFGEACNINCIMCWQNSANRECLDFDTLVKNVDISPFHHIMLQGGEPLFIDVAKRYFDYAASKGKKVSIETNGLLIDDEWAKKIALHSSLIWISLNAATKKMHEFINRGSKWEIVLQNIQRIRYAKEKYHTNVNILGHMTVIIENLKEIPLFIKKFRQLGYDSINFGYDPKTVPNYLSKHPLLKIVLKQKIKKAIKQDENQSAIDDLRLKLLGLS